MGDLSKFESWIKGIKNVKFEKVILKQLMFE